MTRPFTRHAGIAAVLLRDNVDTDAIIPSREIKSVGKTGLAQGLFAHWRAEAQGRFVLDRPEQRGTSILVAGRNFGCGSSREHAVWALAEWGIRAIVAPSFGAIFAANCVRNGIAPVVLDEAAVKSLADAVAPDPPARHVVVDLERNVVVAPDGTHHAFTLPAEQRELLLTGLDPIERTLQSLPVIEAFERADRAAHPWLYL